MQSFFLLGVFLVVVVRSKDKGDAYRPYPRKALKKNDAKNLRK